MSINFSDNLAAEKMMGKFDLLKDEKLMEDWFNYTHKEQHMPIRNYLLAWADAKENFLYHLLGDQLIQRVPINYAKDWSEVKEEMSNSDLFITSLSKAKYAFKDLLTEVCINILGDSESVKKYAYEIFRFFSTADYTFSRLIEKNNKARELGFECHRDFFRKVASIIYWAFDYETLAKNYYNFSERITYPGSDKSLQTSKGQKPFKLLNNLIRYFSKYCSNDCVKHAKSTLEDFRLVHSQILNNKNLHGTLVLSIHPMDFMTMSDNGSNWTSCMSWEDQGDYHAGTLEMMTSSSVLIAYLESDKDWFLMGDGRAWSNKKWRELVICTPQFMTAIKGYPYENEVLDSLVLSTLKDLALKNLDIIFDDAIFRSTEYVDMPNQKRMYFATDIMYNDTANTTLATMFRKDFDPDFDPYDFAYGEGCYCVSCGCLREHDAYYDDDSSNELTCDDCRNVIRCEICRGKVQEYDLVEAPDGRMVCATCYDDHIILNEFTNEWIMDDTCPMTYVEFYVIENNSDDSQNKRRFGLNIPNDYVDDIPQECLKSDWFGTYVIRAFPEENESCKVILEVVNRKLNETLNDYKIVYPSNESEIESESTPAF